MKPSVLIKYRKWTLCYVAIMTTISVIAQLFHLRWPGW